MIGGPVTVTGACIWVSSGHMSLIAPILSVHARASARAQAAALAVPVPVLYQHWTGWRATVDRTAWNGRPEQWNGRLTVRLLGLLGRIGTVGS